MMQVPPSTAAAVVSQVEDAGQHLWAQIEAARARLTEEDAWAAACVAGEQDLALAEKAHASAALELALQVCLPVCACVFLCVYVTQMLSHGHTPEQPPTRA